jgi:hypothetical protein
MARVFLPGLPVPDLLKSFHFSKKPFDAGTNSSYRLSTGNPGYIWLDRAFP